MVKNLSAVQETGVQPLGREDPLEEEMDMTEQLIFSLSLYMQYLRQVSK